MMLAAKHLLGSTKTNRRHLHQRVISSTQDSLCFSKCIDLACAGGLAGIEILEQPVTLFMKTSQVFGIFHCFELLGLLGVRVSLQLGLSLCLCSLLVCDGLG